MRFDAPWVLVLLPLALLPLWLAPGQPLANAWLALTPRDVPSRVLGWLLRALAVGAILALVIGLAGPFRPEYPVEKVGTGAEVVLVLDRSRSMDEGFAGRRTPPPGMRPNSPEALEYYFSQSPARLRESKGKAARRLLSEFTAKRPGDRFALVVFSTLPMRVLDFTAKTEVVQAAIDAGNIGRGLAETNIGLALDAAIEYFVDRPYAGSRIVLLVSDGGDRMDPDTRERLAAAARRARVSIYWMYLRSANSPALMADGEALPEGGDIVPELALHQYLRSLQVPYKAYQAEDSEALKQAIADVDRLENLPITYTDVMPRRDLSAAAHAVALACVLALLAAAALEVRRWA